MNNVVIPGWAFGLGITVIGVMLSIIGFFLIRTLNNLDETIRDLGKRVSDHDVRIAVIEKVHP